MKRLLILAAVLFIVFQSNSEASRFRFGISFNYFYSSLSPYGEWIEIDYDVHVWRPYDVEYDWNPYSIGRWSWTRHGWYWESYEPFGWATYHYGRWYNDDYLGWVWMPGYEWGPSWVEWRYGPDYIGWAPLSPYASYRHGYGIRFSVSWKTSYAHWHFVKYNNFCSPHVHNYFVVNNHKRRIFNNTKYRTNYYSNNGRIINGGIDRSIVERRSGVKIKKRDLTVTSRLDNYSKTRGNQTDKIVLHRPNDQQVRKYRNISPTKIKSERGKSSLRTDKIEIKSRSKNNEVKRKNDLRNEKRTTSTSTKKVQKRDYKSNQSKDVQRSEKDYKVKSSSKGESKKVKKKSEIKNSSAKISKKKNDTRVSKSKSSTNKRSTISKSSKSSQKKASTSRVKKQNNKSSKQYSSSNKQKTTKRNKSKRSGNN